MYKKLFSVVLSVGLITGIGILSTSSASAATGVVGSGASASGSVAGSIMKILEKAAATVATVVGGGAPNSSVAPKAVPGVSQVVCVISTTYVATFVPVLKWTYSGSRLVPIATGYWATTPVQNRICH